MSDSAVILHAGTTQDITGWKTWLDYFAERQVFALSFGRSGYVGSTKKPGRITIDIAHDVAELASALGIKRFVNIGLSGGGQHAIATGFYTGMQQADLDEYADALRDINDLVKRFQKWQEKDLGDSIAGPELSARDKIAVEKPTWRQVIASCAFTMQQGWDWVADDYSSYLKPWGFNPHQVKVPAVIWQGGLDKNVPIQHGKWLSENMPNARLELREDESHLGIFVNYEVEIMESALSLLRLEL